MNTLNIEKTRGKPRILVAPLDWGLGHATRCVPIIRELLAQGCEVWLAGEGAQETLIKSEFPDLPFLELKGYRVNYSLSAIGLVLSIFRQTNKILNAIKYENRWLKKMMKSYQFDGIISDNRYGLHHSSVPCIFITHQLLIKSPLGKWTEKVIQKINYRYINRFTSCWVPDKETGNNLAGELSHPINKPAVSLKYIGIISRFDKIKTSTIDEVQKKEHLLIMLSGPEPQRSILENNIIQEISHYNGTATLVRGLPGVDSFMPSTNMINIYNHLPAEELKKEILRAEYIIGRCGYSTVMDLVVLQKKSILIPTPGQTEQEYLADYLLKKRIAFTISQKDFSLNNALLSASQFLYQLPDIEENQLKETVRTFVQSLSK